jgi:hypothetical protein
MSLHFKGGIEGRNKKKKTTQKILKTLDARLRQQRFMITEYVFFAFVYEWADAMGRRNGGAWKRLKEA